MSAERSKELFKDYLRDLHSDLAIAADNSRSIGGRIAGLQMYAAEARAGLHSQVKVRDVIKEEMAAIDGHLRVLQKLCDCINGARTTPQTEVAE